MAEITAAEDEYVLICGIPPDVFWRMEELLAEFKTRFTYDRGTLEMYRVLQGVPPETYRQLMDLLPEQYLRHSYDGWTLEMMTPRRDHEWIKEVLGRMIETMAMVLDLPIQSTGSTTLNPSAHDRGLQPDKSYYVGKGQAFIGSETYRPGEDPPPDLVIEVEATNPVVPRLPLYAQIGVHEIWRYRHEEVQFYGLGDRGEYETIDRSVAFPFITPADITRFVHQRHETDENSVIRAFVDCARKAHHDYFANP